MTLGCLIVACSLSLVSTTTSAEFPRPDDSSARGDSIVKPATTCTPQIIGTNLEVPAHDLLQTASPQTSEECAQACCGNLQCGGALFEPISAITWNACVKGKPCCFLKTGVAGHRPMNPSPKGGTVLWMIAERPQDGEKLNFLSATLGSHMVLQRGPQRATVWGHTTPGSNVTTRMAPSNVSACKLAGGACRSQIFKTLADKEGTWRQQLPVMPASKVAYDFEFASSSKSAETASMTDVLFGDVYICGGQSNMEYAMPAVTNASAERLMADEFPTIRFFSVGHRTQSTYPLRDLQTIWEPWQVASSTTIDKDFGPGHTMFSTFSAVCWLFGKELSRKLSLGGDVPIGLISNNWGGTKIEVWTPAESFHGCNRSEPNGNMYNAMILPYTVGPMSLTGFTWYQGEANTADTTSAAQYSCLFPEMIKAWRKAFKAPDAYFGFIQLSTWCALPPDSLPQMREAQMTALALPNVGYATNADHGNGCAIHPATKQFCSQRLAASALALHYKRALPWRSPSYKAAAQKLSASNTRVSLAVSFNDVGTEGFLEVHPFNYYEQTSVDCKASFPVNGSYNGSMSEQCAWAALHVSHLGWLNATIDLSGQGMVLTAQLPDGFNGSATVLGSSYGWGPIPMLSVYDKQTGLPVLPWKREVDSEQLAFV